MVALGALWQPILVSGLIVWIVSFLVWAVLPYHQSDYKELPDEDAAIAALRPQKLSPGQYNIPHLPSRNDLRKPEIIKKFHEGPAGFLTVMPRGMPAAGKSMMFALVYYLAVGFCVAYLASRTLGAGADYLAVFRVTGTVAWLAYGAAVVPDAIWFGRPWSAVAKLLFDALVYALLTAGVFGWLWPQ